MRILNPNDTAMPFYAGKCKGNQAPKHVTEQGETKKVKLDKRPATMFDSPKTAEYIYIKQGENWLYVKDKSIFALDALTTVTVTRSPEGEKVGQVKDAAAA